MLALLLLALAYAPTVSRAQAQAGPFDSVAFHGCYADTTARAFETSQWPGSFRPHVDFEECAMAANLAGETRFAVESGQVEPQLARCMYGYKRVVPTLIRCELGASPFEAAPEAECTGAGDWLPTLGGVSYPYYGGGDYRQAVYDIVTNPLLSQWPPMGHASQDVTRARVDGQWEFHWTISGSPHGDGLYRAAARNYIVNWYPSSAFDYEAGSYHAYVSATAAGQHWLSLELPQAVQLVAYDLQGRLMNGAGQSMSSFVVEGSSDGVAWALLDTQTDVLWEKAGTLRFFIADSASVGFFRTYRISTDYHSSYNAVGEWRLYAAPPGPSPSVYSGLSYAGCYTDDANRVFSTFHLDPDRSYIPFEECVIAAGLAGATRFAVQDSQVDPDEANCFFGDHSGLGTSPYLLEPDTSCDGGYVPTLEEETYLYAGGIWTNAVYDIQHNPELLAWPPTGHSFAADVTSFSSDGVDYLRWNLTGSQHGEGTYVAWASSFWLSTSESWQASGAFDYRHGSSPVLNSGWHSGSTAAVQWVAILLPEAIQVVAYDLATRIDGEGTQAPSAFELQGSHDGEVWATVDARNGVSWLWGESKKFYIPSGYSSPRYPRYRLYVTDIPTTYVSIGEVRLYGPQPEPDPAIFGGLSFVGCYVDDETRAFERAVFPRPNIDFEECAIAANLYGETRFAAQYAQAEPYQVECHFGYKATLGDAPYVQAEDSECDGTATWQPVLEGETHPFAGAAYRNAVYDIQPNPTYQQWPPQGHAYDTDVTTSGTAYEWVVKGGLYGDGTYRATASSMYNNYGHFNPPSGAFDYEPGFAIVSVINMWCSETSGEQWLAIELPQAIRLAAYDLGARTDFDLAGTEQTPASFTLQGSDDGVNWVTLDTQIGLVWKAGESKRFHVLDKADSVPFSNFRLHVPSAPTYVAVGDWRLYSVAVVEPEIPIVSSLGYVGCYEDTLTRAFDTYVGAMASGSDGRTKVEMAECLVAANIVGETRFAVQYSQTEPYLAECHWGDKGLLGTSEFVATSDTMCRGLGTWNFPLNGQSYLYNGAAWHNAVYDIVSSPSVRQWPPAGHTFLGDVTSTVVDGQEVFEWVITGTSYGAGLYKAHASAYLADQADDVWPPSSAFDFRMGHWQGFSGWHAALNIRSGWLVIELPEAIQLVAYDLQSRVDCCNEQTPSTFVVEGSHDGVTWEVLDSQAGHGWLPGQAKRFHIAEASGWPAFFRFRLSISAVYDIENLSLGEWRLFGAVAAEPLEPVISGLTFVGCYVESDTSSAFSTLYLDPARPEMSLEECALAANIAGETRFAAQEAGATAFQTQCHYGDNGLLGSAPYLQVADEECIGDNSWAFSIDGVDYPHNGAALRNAVYDVLTNSVVQQWPPVGHSYSEDVTLLTVDGQDVFEWSVTDSPYGSGVYRASASGYYSGSGDTWPPSSAFDFRTGRTSMSSGWHGGTDSTPWLAIELPAEVQLVAYDLQARAGNFATDTPVKFVVAGSADGSSWVELDSQDVAPWQLGETRRFHVSPVLGALLHRHFRLEITESPEGSVVAIGEWRLHSLAVPVEEETPSLLPTSDKQCRAFRPGEGCRPGSLCGSVTRRMQDRLRRIPS